jgi:L-ornithine N5-oxygenase
MVEQITEDSTYDVIGIGIGPANLALAIALEEEAGNLRRLFLDSKPAPVWHPGMLLDDATIQLSVLKDLAMLRNPRSHFTFLNYLKAKGRLLEFLNLRDLFPTRIEFNDYLVWVASELGDRVRYGQEVVAITPLVDEGVVRRVVLQCRDVQTGELTDLVTRSVVLATGGVPQLPEGIRLQPGGRAFHSSETLYRLKHDYPDTNAPYRFIVTGAGQSGAELFHHLLTRYPNADVTATIRQFSYKPIDDSDFTNEIFFPEMVDFLYDLPDDKRRLVLDNCNDVNYAVVDASLIRRLYKLLYQEKVTGRNRARIRSFLEIENLMETEGAVVARFRNLVRDKTLTLKADGLILCSGYAWRSAHPLLEQLKPWLKPTASGYQIERDYRVATDGGFTAAVYMQGFAERTHGVTETVLSLLPVRAGDIARSLVGAQAARQAVASYRF